MLKIDKLIHIIFSVSACALVIQNTAVADYSWNNPEMLIAPKTEDQDAPNWIKQIVEWPDKIQVDKHSVSSSKKAKTNCAWWLNRILRKEWLPEEFDKHLLSFEEWGVYNRWQPEKERHDVFLLRYTTNGVNIHIQESCAEVIVILTERSVLEKNSFYEKPIQYAIKQIERCLKPAAQKITSEHLHIFKRNGLFIGTWLPCDKMGSNGKKLGSCYFYTNGRFVIIRIQKQAKGAALFGDGPVHNRFSQETYIDESAPGEQKLIKADVRESEQSSVKTKGKEVSAGIAASELLELFKKVFSKEGKYKDPDVRKAELVNMVHRVKQKPGENVTFYRTVAIGLTQMAVMDKDVGVRSQSLRLLDGLIKGNDPQKILMVALKNADQQKVDILLTQIAGENVGKLVPYPETNLAEMDDLALLYAAKCVEDGRLSIESQERIIMALANSENPVLYMWFLDIIKSNKDDCLKKLAARGLVRLIRNADVDGMILIGERGPDKGVRPLF